MILERALFHITPGHEPGFEAAMEQAKRESELFPRWRELIGPFFASPPEVDHFEAPSVIR